jgi:hypothetical protein
MVGITKAVTVPFDLFFQAIVGVVCITKSSSWLFIQTIVSVIGITKTVIIPFCCFFQTIVSVVDIAKK